MAMIPLGHWGEATDATAAGQIARTGSRSQDAVDLRIRGLIYPYIVDAVRDSAVLRMAAILAIDAALDGLGISTPHLGVDDDGTPYVDAGARTDRVELDEDGTPVVISDHSPIVMFWFAESPPPTPKVGTIWITPSTGDVKEWK